MSSRYSVFLVVLVILGCFAVPLLSQTNDSDLASQKSSSKTHHKSHTKRHTLTAAERKRRERNLLRSHRMSRAFVASTSLKPMAKQLLENRTKAAYAG
ncbi:MAG TPA: hypothetical protein VKW78_13945, partial [Terriglobales bacterium]|nr:hypothetical protein [Terriglobales bacterium]